LAGAGGVYSTPSDPLTGFGGSTSKGRWRKGEGGKGKRGGKGRDGKGRGRA